MAFETVGAIVGFDAALQACPFRAGLQAEAEGRRFHHGIVVDQAAEIELRFGLGEAAGGDGDVVEDHVLAEGVAVVLVIAEVVEQQAVAFAEMEDALDARHGFVAQVEPVAGVFVGLAVEVDRAVEAALRFGLHRAEAQGEAVIVGARRQGTQGGGHCENAETGGEIAEHVDSGCGDEYCTCGYTYRRSRRGRQVKFARSVAVS
jgi:hypothetical protein